MSNIVQALVERKVVGSPTKKAVLSYMAVRASDNGEGVWTSKANIARDTEFSRRAVQYAIADLVSEGVLKKVGTKACRNGETDEFAIQIDVVKGLESTRATDAPVQEVHMTRARGAQQDVQEVHPNSPLIILEQSIVCKPKKSTSDWFFEFWEAYPRKVSKIGAKKKFQIAMKSADPQLIVDGAKRYAVSKKVRDGYVKDPKTWLGDGCWDDEDVSEAGSSKASRYKRIAEGRA